MKHVVIIGAGISGLVAATLLAQKGYRVTVLESRDRVGGRTLSKTFHGVAFDLGGQFVSTLHTRLRAWIRRLGLHLEAVHRDNSLNDTASLRNQIFRYDPARNQGLPDFGTEATQDLEQAVAVMDQMARSLPTKAWTSPQADQLDYMSTKELFEKTAQTPLARAFLTSFFQSLLCFEPQQISALCYLDYLRSGGYFGVLHGIDESGAQAFFIREGAQSVSIRLAEALGNSVHLGETVKQVEWNASGCQVTTQTARYECDAVLVTVPPVLYDSLGFEPYLPKEKMILAQRSDMGLILKTLTFYKTPFWREKGLSGVSDNDQGPITESYDASTGGLYVLVGFICGKHASKWMQVSRKQRKQAILQQYATLFESSEALNPRFFDEYVWNGERFSIGGYVGVPSIGTFGHFGNSLRAQYPPVFFAGTETSLWYKGYMEGAIRSAEDVVPKMETYLGVP